MFLASSTVAASALSGPYLRSAEPLAPLALLSVAGAVNNAIASPLSGLSTRRQSQVVQSSPIQVISAGQSFVPGAERTLKL